MSRTIRNALKQLLIIATAGLALATVIGMLAPVEPLMDLINHFRLHILLATIAVLAVSSLFKQRAVTTFISLVLALNLLLATPAFFLTAPHAERKDANLRILSLNVGSRTDQALQIENTLRARDADIALLLEVEPSETAMLEKLRSLYPYQINCAQIHLCRLALLSKHPIVSAETHERKGLNPTHLSATLSHGDKSLHVIGVHLTRPFIHSGQREELAFLAGKINQAGEPLIVLGDFNLTPWSWELFHFQRQTDLKRHRTFGVSWPVNRPPLFAQLLIDHILTRGPLYTVRAYTGPDAGSDHLPVVVDLSVAD